MKKIVLVFISILTLMLTSCNKNDKKADIITTLYPQYSIAKEIVGDKLTVSLIVPIGSDGHHFTPTSKDLIDIKNAKLFLYTSDSMEVWVKNISGNKVDLSLGLDVCEHEHEHHQHDHVHYFVSISNQIKMTLTILEEIEKIDPNNSSFYEENATALINRLTIIKEEFLLLNKPLTIYYVGHDVFLDFTHETEINVFSLMSSFTDEASITSKDLQALINTIKNENISVIFYDSLTMKKTAKTIQNDLKKDGYSVEIRPFHSFHNVNLEDYKINKSITELWEENLNVIKEFYE
ncbi:MAG: zinc ABC transporter substrate-binding protein [Acholeplasmataceae bacterium]|jgi:zinc transport system substrate-binding protein|nr:zinc ABC transporter substrate-binding protein [Acholeplasmataceae bacterium]